MGANQRQILRGVGAALVLAFGVIWIVPKFAGPQDVVPVAVVTPSDAVAAPAVTPDPQTAVIVAPSFDTFQRDADGTALVAGRADPLAKVDVVLAGKTVGSVQADTSGAFVAFVTVAPSESPRALRLVADPSGAAVLSDETIMVAPFALPDVVAVLPDDPLDPQSAPSDVTVATAVIGMAGVDDPAPVRTDIVAEQAAVAQEPAALPVLVSGAEGVRVLQTGSTRPQVLSNVALDTITYDPDGDVLLSGRATGSGFVRVYIDNQPVTTQPIAASGDWRTDLPNVDTGIYTLRIDEVDAGGTVVSRVETPFKREEPADVIAVLAEDTAVDGFEVAVRTVQPGTTLWAIARDQFGEGVMYVAVFEANRDLIRDPDLIFPGQVFRMPQLPDEAGQ